MGRRGACGGRPRLLAAVPLLLVQLAAESAVFEDTGLDLSRLAHINLGGYGPDAGAPVLLFKGAAMAGTADLVVAVEDGYQALDPGRNGAHGRGNRFGMVNIRSGTTAHLRLRFLRTGTEELALLRELLLTFYVADANERVVVSAGPRSELSAYCLALGSAVHARPLEGAISFEPTGAHDLVRALGPQLSPEQRAQAVVLAFRNISEVNVSVQVSRRESEGSVNYVFSGGAAADAAPPRGRCVAWRGPDMLLRRLGLGQAESHCERTCRYKNMGNGTCRLHVRREWHERFRSSPRGCQLARQEVLQVCEHCGECLNLEVCAQEPFDCFARRSVDDRLQRPDPAKDRYCCERYALGCPATAPERYDCLVGFATWLKDWSIGQRDWCCKHHRLGCPTSAATTRTATTAVVSTTTRTVTRRSSAKVGTNTPKRTASRRTTSAPPPSAAAGEARGSSVRHTSTTTSPTLPQEAPPWDCSSNASTWQWSWSRMKKEWCCKHEPRRCMPRWVPRTASTSTTAEARTVGPDDCAVRKGDSPGKWSKKKQEYCCENHNIGCPHRESSGKVGHTIGPGLHEGWGHAPSPQQAARQEFECLASFASRERWTHQQASWCCSHAGLACAGEGPAVAAEELVVKDQSEADETARGDADVPFVASWASRQFPAIAVVLISSSAVLLVTRRQALCGQAAVAHRALLLEHLEAGSGRVLAADAGSGYLCGDNCPEAGESGPDEPLLLASDTEASPDARTYIL